MPARPAGAHAPSNNNEVPTKTALRNTSPAHRISASHGATTQANNIVAASPVPNPPPSPPPAAVQVDAPSAPEDLVVADTPTHPQHTTPTRTFWDRFFGRNKEPTAPLPFPRLKRRPRYHNHQHYQVYPRPAGHHIRYRGDGDSGNPLQPRSEARLVSPSPEGGRGGEGRGRQRGGNSPEPRRGGHPGDYEARRGRWSNGESYEEVIVVDAWRPKKRGSRTKVCYERRRWDM
jgi:hypothetical protein